MVSMLGPLVLQLDPILIHVSMSGDSFAGYAIM